MADADSRQEGRLRYGQYRDGQLGADAAPSALGVQKEKSADVAERQLRKSIRASDAQRADDAEMDAIHAEELAAEGAPNGSLGDRQELSKVQQRRGAIAAAEKPAAQDEKAPVGEPQTNGISDSPTAQTTSPPSWPCGAPEIFRRQGLLRWQTPIPLQWFSLRPTRRPLRTST